MIDILYANGVRMVTITGGEPLLWKDLERVLKYTQEKDMKVMLYTHGLHFFDRMTGEIQGQAEAKLNAILDRVTFLSISFDIYHAQAPTLVDFTLSIYP